MSRPNPDIVGRYLYLTVDGTEYRVYYEEAGAGIPIVCQHTAGADGRQWRHFLEDPDVTSRFRVLVPDLPYHGKSLPPEGERWWESEYSLTKEFFEKFVVAFSAALGLDRPVFMGCSMGGHLAPDLALDHPEAFRAVVGLEAAVHSHGADGLVRFLNHPEISNDFRGAQMYGICAPTSPEASRRETAWVYSQGHPSVFKGDLNYYFVEHDLTDVAAEIDTGKVAVYILSGEYDYSAPPELGQALADQIAGSHFIAMHGMGHFPMSENYPLFKKYVAAVLDELAAGASTPRSEATAP
jgi:pimeloyl-ACP methyl ester carboxylesterase